MWAEGIGWLFQWVIAHPVATNVVVQIYKELPPEGKKLVNEVAVEAASAAIGQAVGGVDAPVFGQFAEAATKVALINASQSEKRPQAVAPRSKVVSILVIVAVVVGIAVVVFAAVTPRRDHVQPAQVILDHNSSTFHERKPSQDRIADQLLLIGKPLPINVHFRSSKIGKGKVIQVIGRMLEEPLVVHCQFENGPSFRATVQSFGINEIGWAELNNYVVKPGSKLTISASGYQKMEVVVPWR